MSSDWPVDAATALVDDASHLGRRKRGAIARDAFELVESAAGVAERAAAEHGDAQAGGRGDGSDEKGRLVAHAAAGVFIDGRTSRATVRGAAQIELHAGGTHRLRERLNLLRLHAAQERGHEKSAELRVIDGAVAGAVCDMRDLFSASARDRPACGG